MPRPPAGREGVVSEDLFQAIRREARDLSEELPFGEYLERVRGNPRLARTAHALVNDMLRDAGVEVGPDGRPRYLLFRDELFGAEEALRQVAAYFAAAARGLDIRRRILLLVGPPGSGKSTLVNLLKAGLERYTRTPEGAVYAIKGCPVREDPLHLLPPHHRAALGVPVEGELCPHCRWLLREVHGGDVARVQVERVVFSAAAGVGIGTFVATDPRSEDLTRLVGQVDLSLLAGASLTQARRAFRLDGELNAANRGLADLVELFKMDERFLAALLTLAEERVIKLSGPGLLHADEAVVAQSNLAEYEALVAEPRAAALRDRLVVVRVGYVLRVADEVRIYAKMLREADLGASHLSPLALPAGATLAVLSRLERPERGAGRLLRKLRLYDGRFVPDADPEEAEALRAASPGEGLTGLSPRFVVNQVSNALAQGPECLSGMDVLMTLWEGLSQRAGFREEEREGWSELFGLAREEYDEMVRRVVRRAMVSGFQEAAAALARDAREELTAWSRGAPEAELPTVRRLEEALRIPSYRRNALREVWRRHLADAGAEAPHRAEGRLEEAVERVLLPDWRQAAAALVGTEEGVETARQRRAQLRGRLLAEAGFCEACADDVIAHAARLVAPRRERRAGARTLRWLGA